jgi:hypothetical protein
MRTAVTRPESIETGIPTGGASTMAPQGGILGRIRSALMAFVPEGYQDDAGFHYGKQPSKKGIQWPPAD